MVTTETIGATIFKDSNIFYGTSLYKLKKINNCSGDNFDIYYSKYYSDVSSEPLTLQYYKVYPKNIPIWITKYKSLQRIEDGIGKKKILFGSDEEMLKSCPLS